MIKKVKPVSSRPLESCQSIAQWRYSPRFWPGIAHAREIKDSTPRPHIHFRKLWNRVISIREDWNWKLNDLATGCSAAGVKIHAIHLYIIRDCGVVHTLHLSTNCTFWSKLSRTYEHYVAKTMTVFQQLQFLWQVFSVACTQHRMVETYQYLSVSFQTWI